MAARVWQARWGDAQPNLRELTIEFQEVEKICFRITPEKRASVHGLEMQSFPSGRRCKVRIASRYGTLASWLSDKWGVMNSVRYVEFHAITRRDGTLLRPLVACSRLV